MLYFNSKAKLQGQKLIIRKCTRQLFCTFLFSPKKNTTPMFNIAKANIFRFTLSPNTLKIMMKMMTRWQVCLYFLAMGTQWLLNALISSTHLSKNYETVWAFHQSRQKWRDFSWVIQAIASTIFSMMRQQSTICTQKRRGVSLKYSQMKDIWPWTQGLRQGVMISVMRMQLMRRQSVAESDLMSRQLRCLGSLGSWFLMKFQKTISGESMNSNLVAKDSFFSNNLILSMQQLAVLTGKVQLNTTMRIRSVKQKLIVEMSTSPPVTKKSNHTIEQTQVNMRLFCSILKRGRMRSARQI